MHEASPVAAHADTSVASYFRAIAAANCDLPALTTVSKAFTYGELDRWSDAVAATLLAAKVPVDRPVAIVMTDMVALVPAVIGTVKAGHFFVVIDSTDPQQRIATLLQDSHAGSLLMSRDEPAASLFSPMPLVVMPMPGEVAGTVTGEVPANQYVQLVFTSATTGRPKGVVTQQRSFVQVAIDRAVRHGRLHGERCSYIAVPGVARGLNTIFSTLLAGATLCAFDARSSTLDELVSFIAREKIQLLSITPALFRRLMQASPANLDLRSVRRLFLGGDRATIADFQLFRDHFPAGCTLDLTFAATEAGGVMANSIPRDATIEGPLLPVGRPLPGVEVRLVDDEGHEVQEGETGEIVVRSHDVAPGYWNDPGLTAERFELGPDGVRTFFTGDLARRDADGVYTIVGRKDDRLKIRGRRIDPAEVESALLATGDVRDTAVVGKPDGYGEPALTAYVVTVEGREWNPRELRAAIRNHLPDWMVPSRIISVPALPTTRAGKIDRAALVSRVDEAEAAETTGASDRERHLQSVFMRVLRMPVDLDDSIFEDLGVDSIAAAHLAGEIEKECGRTVAVSALIELDTVRKLAASLDRGEECERHLIALRREGTSAPIFCVAGGGGSVIAFRELAAVLGHDQPFYGIQTHAVNPASLPPTTRGVAAVYVDAIRAVQPDGPYRLAGYSGGGLIAYEMACQLQRGGSIVEFLGLIDTAVGPLTKASMWTRIRNRFSILRRDPKRAFAFQREAVTRPFQWMLRSMIERARNRGMDVPAGIINSIEALRATRDQYVPDAYPGRVTLFLARNGLQKIRLEPTLGWERIDVGTLDVVTVGGDHASILEQPDVRSLAAAIQEALVPSR